MSGEQVFDVPGVVLDAAAVDDVLAATRDGDVSAGADDGEVAGAEPASGGERIAVGLRVAEVSREQQRAADLKLTLLTGRQRRSVPVPTTLTSVPGLGRPADAATILDRICGPGIETGPEARSCPRAA